ncbi:unnamed protein product [Prorocentrum cordatum]|uniref:Uncharacterized protein n=1 Tax=Prorocentrum cordatum TaxID=2364126 RepID=A0ABN9U502_9DINO|nr:unnamed protein product [Polarella glacialis]
MLVFGVADRRETGRGLLRLALATGGSVATCWMDPAGAAVGHFAPCVRDMYEGSAAQGQFRPASWPELGDGAGCFSRRRRRRGPAGPHVPRAGPRAGGGLEARRRPPSAARGSLGGIRWRKRNTHKLLALRADFLDPRLGPHQGAAAGAPGAAPECRPLQLRRVPHARQSRLGEHRRRMHVFLPPRALYFEPYWCSGRRHPTGLCAVPVLCHVPALVRSSSPRFSASRSG